MPTLMNHGLMYELTVTMPECAKIAAYFNEPWVDV